MKCIQYRDIVRLILIFVLFSLTGCGAGEGGGGSSTTSDSTPPSAPTGVAAVAGDGQITLIWNVVPNATSYNLYMASASGVSKDNYSTLPDDMRHAGVTNPYIHTGMVNGKTYYFVVTSINANRESDESGEVSATPISSSETTNSIKLPKTGQTISYATGDDGDLQKGVTWPNPRFTVGTGIEADCVTDNLTGLMWVRSPDSTARTWEEALFYANNLSLCGYTDWRLPNINELKNLLNAGESKLATWLNTQGFSNVQLRYYWTSTSSAYSTDSAFIVNMWEGEAYKYHKTYNNFVLPVRSGQSGMIQLPKTGQTTCYNSTGTVISCAGTGQDGDIHAGVPWPSPRFTDNGDDTVTDNLASLLWTKNIIKCVIPWWEALSYVKEMNARTKPNFGYNDWRLPNINELMSLIDAERSVPVLPVGHPFLNVTNNYYWSSTRYAYSTDRVWSVNMEEGGMFGRYVLDYGGGCLWPVRSEQ